MFNRCRGCLFTNVVANPFVDNYLKRERFLFPWSVNLAWNVRYDVMAVASGRPRQADTRHKVLIVDDDRLVCWSLQRALDSSTYEVVVCRSGEQAIEEMQKQRFDLVITDFKMEGNYSAVHAGICMK